MVFKITMSVYKIINGLIALVWLANGLFCKLLNGVPRHQRIVARILGQEHAGMLSRAIGLSEVLMAIWILSGIRPRWCAITQIVLIAVMNAIEFFEARDLLLFGGFNAVMALGLIIVIFYNEFALRKMSARQV
jgi:uncharacterized membrane protein YphA (DoxX/SURF4 family)